MRACDLSPTLGKGTFPHNYYFVLYTILDISVDFWSKMVFLLRTYELSP